MYNFIFTRLFYTLHNIVMKHNPISLFVKQQRKKAGLTQEMFAIQAGVGLAFLRALEQGKETLKMSNVNRVLAMFGYELGPVEAKRK